MSIETAVTGSKPARCQGECASNRADRLCVVLAQASCVWCVNNADLHFKVSKGFPVEQQDDNNEGEGHIGPQYAQGGDAGKVAKEGLLADLQASAENNRRQKEPASCGMLSAALLDTQDAMRYQQHDSQNL